MKKGLLLSVIVITALAAVTSYRAFFPKTTIAALMLDENIEALTQGEENYPQERTKCLEEGGFWNMASVCADAKIEMVTCTISGEITLFGVTLKGSYTKGRKYSIPWARYTCTSSIGNCCKKQGLYSDKTKLA